MSSGKIKDTKSPLFTKRFIVLIGRLFSILNNKRLPERSDIISVYSIIAFMIYSWTFITFFFKLSSWVYYLTIGEIANILTYAMVTDLLESILILSGLLLLCLLLPPTFLKEDFRIRGTWLSIVFFGTLMVYLVPIFNIRGRGIDPGFWLMVAIVLTLTLTIILSRLSFTRRFAHFIADRMTVFLVVFTPISVISFFILVIRVLI